MNEQVSTAGCQLKELDQRILYESMAEARNNSAPVIAERIGVSPGTVRSHIKDLEEHGVITGYHAHIDFERTDGHLSTLFVCSVSFVERKTAARAIYEIPGVVSIRVLMGGRRNFHILAIGENTSDLRRIGTTLSKLGVDIEDEMLIENDEVRAYAPFGPDEIRRKIPADVLSLSSDSEVVELTVQSDTPVAGETIFDVVENELLVNNPLVVSITREDELLTPHGSTTIRPDDIVTLFFSGGVSDETIRPFVEPRRGCSQ